MLLGVESRLATLTIDTNELEKLMEFNSRPDIPDSLKQVNIAQMVTGLPVLFNTLNIRRAIIPAANGHMTARALARYYAALANGGIIPPPHSNLSSPPLGSHIHIPKFPPLKIQEKRRGIKNFIKDNTSMLNLNGGNQGYSLVDISIEGGDDNAGVSNVKKMFNNPKIHDAFMGVGDYSTLVYPGGVFGLGFRRLKSDGGKLTGFGHSGVGGSTGFCNIEHDFSIAITLNKMSLGGVTRRIVQLVCSELNVPVPDEFSEAGLRGPDMQIYARVT